MGKRRYGRRRSRGGGFGIKRILSVKNILYTLGAMIMLPKIVSVSPQIAAAAGGFMGAGPVGAIAGYVAAPTLSGMTGGLGAGGGGVTLG